MRREEAIRKIRKLLAIAEGKANEAESVSAALKAQKIIAEFNVEDFEIADEEEPIVTVESRVGTSREWRKRLASVVADNFRCKMFFKGRFAFQKRIVFLGYRMDAQAAAITYEHLFKVGHKFAERARRECLARYGTGEGVYNTYALGFVDGVREELEKQSQALMIVCPPKVNDAYEGIGFTAGEEPDRLKIPGSVMPDQYREGYVAGKDAVKATRLGEGESLLLEEVV